jgi:hypothetical protein
MILDVHIAFLFAALAVLFGITYSLGQFLDGQTKRVREQRKGNNLEADVAEALNA